MSSKKKGLLSLLAIAAVMLVLMLASGGIYNGLASIGRHNVVPAGNSFTAGTYEGTGQGKMGDIRVKVTLSDTAIESIEVLRIRPLRPFRLPWWIIRQFMMWMTSRGLQ